MTTSHFRKKGLGAIAIAAVVFGCYKEPVFPPTPEIKYVTFEKFVRLDQTNSANKDSVVVTVSFKDGDGDLGYNALEREAAQRTNKFNYLVKAFRQKNGRFAEFKPLESLSGYFPRLRQIERPGPMEGLLSYSMDFLHPFTITRDTVKFEIQIRDRSGNLSNSVETDPIVLKNL